MHSIACIYELAVIISYISTVELTQDSIIPSWERSHTSRVVIHTLMWILLGLIYYINQNPMEQSFWFGLSNTLLLLFFHMIVVYFNIYYLIPSFLSRKSVLIYLLLFVISCFIVTPLRTLVFYLKFAGSPEAQNAVLSDQISTFLSLFIVGAFSTLAKILTDWLRSQRQMRALETENMQSELKFLRSQVNPHFLFNTLNSLYALTLKKSDKAPEIVIKLSEIMRYMLYECNEKTVPLEKEIKYMRNYVELERLRHGEHADITFECKGEIKDQRIAPLMFIPFFENSFKHGISNQLNEGFVHIQLELDQKKVNLEIVNSKADASSKLPLEGTKSGGIGLQNIQRRLDLLYPKKYRLEIDDEKDKYKVELEIKLS
jgi:sensor histidine kinase YesM